MSLHVAMMMIAKPNAASRGRLLFIFLSFVQFFLSIAAAAFFILPLSYEQQLMKNYEHSMNSIKGKREIER
jgi:uncharacterized membrane protein YwzB